MRICFPIVAAILACLWLFPSPLPDRSGAMMQPPLSREVLHTIYSAAAAASGTSTEADADSDAAPTTAPAPAPTTAPTQRSGDVPIARAESEPLAP
jgi:hypothetical protein